MKAIIKEATIKSIYDLWDKKPKSLDWGDTDVIIVKMETKGGKEITHTFYTSLLHDGSFSLNPQEEGLG